MGMIANKMLIDMLYKCKSDHQQKFLAKLVPWTQNKSIQKACESYRITDKQKQLLKKYKI